MSKSRRNRKDKFPDDQGRSFNLLPKTEKQQSYLNALNDDSVILSLGPAGTGKTYVAAAYAAKELVNGNIDKIILTRPNIPTGRSIGAFPGTIDEKMEPWLAAMLSIIKDVMGNEPFICNRKNENIELIPLEVIRGRSWDNSIILADEAQNYSIEELKAITTRIGQDSKLIFMGDVSQSDIKNGENNALHQLMKIVEKHNIPSTTIIEFGLDDIVRSDICAAFVKAFFKEKL